MAMVPSAAVPFALLGTSIYSAWSEKQHRVSAKAGSALLSFGTMCLLSNLRIVPCAHEVYDFAWGTLLPMSLAAVVLGCPLTARDEREGLAQKNEMRSVCIAFGLGACGSVLGVLVAYLAATRVGLGIVSMNAKMAAQAAAALAATYIGGSANLFAVAGAVGLTSGEGGVLSALAATDVLLMALYFAVLVVAHKSLKLQQMFRPSVKAPELKADKAEPLRKLESVAESATSAVKVMAKFEDPSEKLAPLLNKQDRTAATLFTLVVARIVCLFGPAAQKLLPRAGGLDTMAITLGAVFIAQLIRKVNEDALATLQVIAPSTSAFLLTVFFGAMGAQARLTELSKGGPALVTFAAIAMLVHGLVIIFGSRFVNAIAKRMGWCASGDKDCKDDGMISFDDVLVASNANIGGPSTAGTFAAIIGRRALVVPAAIWGTVGYAIASSIGLALFGVLGK